MSTFYKIFVNNQGRLRNSWMQALHWPGPRRPCTQCWLRPPGDSRQRKEAERTTPAHCTQPSWYGSTWQGRLAYYQLSHGLHLPVHGQRGLVRAVHAVRPAVGHPVVGDTAPVTPGHGLRHAMSRCCHAMSRVTLMLHVTWQTGRSRLAAGCRCWPPPPPCPRGWSSTGYSPARSGHSEGSTLAVKTVEPLTCTR